MPAKHYKEFGKRMRSYRNSKRISQEKLSEITGISTVHISKLENGQREPCLDTMIKISNALDVRISDLVSELEDL